MGDTQQQQDEQLQPEADNTGPDIVRLVGAQLKALRINAGLEREDFGRRMGYSPHTIASIEQGRRRPPEGDFLDKADDLLEAGGLLKIAKKEVIKAALPQRFRSVAALEERASEYHSFQNQVMPGLLQTEEYARALFRMRRPALDDETVEERVTARLARQEIFQRKPLPVMSFILQEVVLHYPYGGCEVLRGQWQRLLQVGRMRNVEIQVMPTDREDHACAGGPLILLRPEDEPMLAYAEVQGRGGSITELKAVRQLHRRYEILQAQALNPWESLGYIEKLLGAK
jgi:transcriptional regulator with XRE-family HTH domain